MNVKFMKKLAYFEQAKAEVEEFVAQGGDLKAPEAAPLGVKFLKATNEKCGFAGGGDPFLIPVGQKPAASKK